ncbi:Sll0314/Alr1548 family TPR repeat-containing protein [Pseudanabaena mucicola]|uniref:Tetratricopeptide repeat protein n=1 Tax=Pseudanabaena mucicola FACHB-723 TaxID=2692860 RepID=A0ABR7ZXX8_9CYAN|nr:Sll0314/Alr1548 family TPR repeat-containing protein [Pseudanabaena mucicola]MBD2188732.1 tetratricopeptide repeat protein [Pseudanabaena mucicola FACHB-723]
MKRSLKILSTSLLAALVSVATVMPSFAADPFRSKNARPIGSETQKAFELMFKEGNYNAAVKQLNAAVATEANEPLLFALRASTFFATEDYLGMQVAGQRVRKNAESLRGKDNLRAYIYLAASDLIEAGYIVKTQGISSAPRALPLVQSVLDYLQKAKDIDPNDPELNLIKGYVDMLIASVLPLSDLESALQSLRQFAAPDYLKWRGIALAYRDARRPDLAIDAVNKALASAPNNPELHYLKGQILWMQGGNSTAEAKKFFELALSKSNQMNPSLLSEIRDQCRNLSGGVKCAE